MYVTLHWMNISSFTILKSILINHFGSLFNNPTYHISIKVSKWCHLFIYWFKENQPFHYKAENQHFMWSIFVGITDALNTTIKSGASKCNLNEFTSLILDGVFRLMKAFQKIYIMT